MDEGDAKMKKIVGETDNTITVMSDEATAEIKAIADGQIAEWVKSMEANGLPGQAMLDDARALVAKHSN